MSRFWEIRGYHAEGRDRLAALLRLERTRAYPRSRALVLDALGVLALDQGDSAAARACHEESLTIMRELGDRCGIARSLLNLGWVATDVADYATGRILHEESLAIARELGDRRVIIDGLETSAYLALAVGRMDRTAPLQGAAEALRDTIGVPLSPSERAVYEVTRLADTRAALGEQAFAAAWAEGRAMTLEEAAPTPSTRSHPRRPIGRGPTLAASAMAVPSGRYQNGYARRRDRDH